MSHTGWNSAVLLQILLVVKVNIIVTGVNLLHSGVCFQILISGRWPLSVSQDFIWEMFCVKAWEPGDLVTLVNSHQHRFAQCLAHLGRIEHPFSQKFRGCDDLGHSWDSVAITKMERDQQISKLQDDHQEHQLCVVFEALVWIQIFKKPFWSAELDSGPHFPAWIQSWGLTEPHLPRDFLY